MDHLFSSDKLLPVDWNIAAAAAFIWIIDRNQLPVCTPDSLNRKSASGWERASERASGWITSATRRRWINCYWRRREGLWGFNGIDVGEVAAAHRGVYYEGWWSLMWLKRDRWRNARLRERLRGSVPKNQIFTILHVLQLWFKPQSFRLHSFNCDSCEVVRGERNTTLNSWELSFCLV